MTDQDLTLEEVETIAAFLDRELSPSERAAFLERLDRDEALYEVFVETVRYRDQRAREEAEPVAMPERYDKGSWTIPLTLAALLAVAIAGVFFLDRGGTLTSAGLARALIENDRLESTLGAGWTEQGWRRTRGLTHRVHEVDSAFRIGVHTVDLEIALRLDRHETAGALTRRIEYELEGVELGDLLQRSYAELRQAIEEERPREDLLQLAARLDQTAGDLLGDNRGYLFGKWAEAGKLAARSGNESLLRSRPFRSTLRDLRQNDWTDLVAEQLDLIAANVTNHDDPLDLEALAAAFTTIIDES